MPTTGEELSAECFRVKDAGTKALELVQPALASSPIRLLTYAIKGRVKSKSDIHNKVLRKRKESAAKVGYEPADMTDVCGLRIVTLFQPDIVEVVGHLLKMVQHDSSVVNSPFVKGSVREILVFSNRPDGDPLSMATPIVQAIKDAGFSHVIDGPKASASGYSSVHFILETSVDVERKGDVIARAAYPVEIQIRTIFEDAWGEIDHKLRYRTMRDIDSEKPDERLLNWQPHLNALKTYVDGCSQYADIIKRQAIDLDSQDPTLPPDLNPMETARDALKLFSSLRQSIRDKLRAAYSARERLASAKTDQERREHAAETIELFQQIENSENDYIHGGTQGGARLGYYVKMEQAFGLLHFGDEESVARAIDIYRLLAERNEADPVVYYRWGRALSIRERHEEAMPMFRKCLLNLDRSSGQASRTPWVAPAVRRTLAFSLWRVAHTEAVGSPETQRDLFKEAFLLCVDAEKMSDDGSGQELQALNSGIYYALEFWEHGGTTDEHGILENQVRMQLGKLLAHINIETSNDAAKLDTLGRALIWFGNKPGAARCANRIIHLLGRIEESELTSDERDSLKVAHEIVAKSRG